MKISKKDFFGKQKFFSKSKHFVRYLIPIFFIIQIEPWHEKNKKLKNSNRTNLKIIEQKKYKIYESKEYVLVSIFCFIYLFVLLFLDNFLRKKGYFWSDNFPFFLKKVFFSKSKHFVTYLIPIFYLLSKIIIRIKSPKTTSNICIIKTWKKFI